MFIFGGCLVVAFMETINSTINSKDTKTERVSVDEWQAGIYLKQDEIDQ